MPGTIHVSPPIPTKTLHGKYHFLILQTKKLRIQNVKAIAQGSKVAEAGHFWDAKAHVLSVAPSASRWVKENNTCAFVFLILNIFVKSVPSLYFIFPVHKMIYCKEVQSYPPQAVLRKVKNSVDKA